MEKNTMAKGPYMEFLTGKNLQTSINTYHELVMPTPTSKTENLAMLIHSIELIPSALADTAPANADNMKVHLSKSTKADVTPVFDRDILAFYQATTVLNAVMNAIVEQGEMLYNFDPPILYPKAYLYFGINTIGFAATRFATCRVGYTLEKVSREDFISALVE